MNSSPTQHVGFIGLGQMGAHMARNLMGPDVALTVCARREQTLAPFRALGVAVTTRVHDLAACEIVFLCLPGDEDVRAVLVGEDGLLPLLTPGKVVVDCSTISYETTLELARACAEREVAFLDVPVSGMEARARDGTLTMMAGGDAKTLARVEPLLLRMGRTLLHMGGPGAGQLAKLVNQLLFDVNMAVLAEILPLSVKMGLAPEKMGAVVNSGTGRSYASEFFIPRILEDSFTSGYPMADAYKDLVSGGVLAARENIPLPVTHAATVTYQMALRKGYGSEDKGAMIKIYEELLGVRFRRD